MAAKDSNTQILSSLDKSVIKSAVNALQSAVSNVKKLNTSLTELSAISDLSAAGLAKITAKAYALGETVGKTGSQVIDAVTQFKRAGFDLEESVNLAKDALIMTNIAEGIDQAGDSAKYLISIMKGYENTSSEFSKKILDSMNEVSNTQNIDFNVLADGAQKLSASANQAGISFDQMLGTLTGGYEVLGDMEDTASGLTAIFSRLQSIQLINEEEAASVTKLQDTFHSATGGTVNIVDQSTGQLRNVYDILNDLGSVWDSLDKNTQESLALLAGGTSQYSLFQGMMNSWDSVEKSVQAATNSMGSAETENQKYLDSISGKMSQFENAVEHLSATVVNSDVIKFFVELGTAGVKAVDSIVDAITPLGALFASGAAYLSGKNIGKTYECTVSESLLYCFEYAPYDGDFPINARSV